MKVKTIILFFIFSFLFVVPVYAIDSSMQDEFYKQQMQESGAEDLPNHLPEETRKILNKIGIEGIDWKSINNLTPQGIFSQIQEMIGEKSISPFKASASVIAVMLLCALLNGMKLSYGEKPLGGVIGLVGTLCICTVIIHPIVSCISNAAGIIKAAAGFLLACVPVLTGIMIAGGQTISASSYSLLMVGVGDAISLLAANVLVPLLNIFLSLSIVSSVSLNLNLHGICDMFSKVVKWVLGFCMTVFTGLLTIQSVVTSSADSTGTKAAKFVISSFVPVVGGALGDALNTVQGCVKLLKSGVGAFGLLGAAFIFLPVIIECMIWLFTLYICSGIGDIFELKEITSLLRSASKVLEMMLAILLCCMTVLTVSTVLMLIIGGAGG